MSEGKILYLTLNKKWFDMIASGDKKEEYRELKPYWETRFIDSERINQISIEHFAFGDGFKHFDTVIAKNGYSKDAPTIKWKHLGFSVKEGKSNWGAVGGKKYFVLKIGEIFN